MNFYVLTLFPEMIRQGLSASIIGRAMEKGILQLNTVDIREFSENKHNRVDDYPYGGGAGMVMAAGPVVRAFRSVKDQIAVSSGSNESTVSNETPVSEKTPRVVYLTPQGKVFNQSMAEDFAKEENLIFLCGHYEGIDERALEMIVTDNVSIGDYVLTGGELPSMVMIDAISRLVPGVLNNDTSAEFETFQDNLLEYPQYTRPDEFEGRKVPEVLLSGHHGKVEEWRRQQSLLRTVKNRPDLMEKAILSEKDKSYLSKIKQ
ncbi:MAG: tRNA (guanine37-N1)-methyltransferase [Anaerocolumna sp.]|jgi:tRNA (guanine37-N1)-methyltransferase|nr:tRNA (guanine37-N1)-methyltransferase [Anaerocolumna sp.]